MKNIVIDENLGFDGRVFLTKDEWITYRRRKPVRYIRKKKPNVCEICGKKLTKDNPLENSHKIGFRIGIMFLGLTPDYVDRDDNIVSAHKKFCNKRAEVDLLQACILLMIDGIKKLPEYLPASVHQVWEEAKMHNKCIQRTQKTRR